MTTSGKKDKDIRTFYEIFREGKPKYQLVWTNHSKKFLIDGKQVSETEWDAAIKKDKA